jgi:hypothetical protein
MGFRMCHQRSATCASNSRESRNGYRENRADPACRCRTPRKRRAASIVPAAPVMPRARPSARWGLVDARPAARVF